jgi:hypothetical protein
MIKSIRLGIGATLLAAAQLSSASIAEVNLSNISLSASGGEWWYWLPSDVTWLPKTSSTEAALMNPAVSAATPLTWHGNPLDSTVTDGSSFASALITPTTLGDLNGTSASAKVVANDGQSGWAFSNIFDGYIMIGGGATFTVSAILNTISASGSMSQANATIELCSTDLTTDVCEFDNYAEAFVDATSGAYSGPSTLTASWTNSGATTWIKMRLGLSASANSDVVIANVPEPSALALTLLGLLGVVVAGRRRTA